MLTRVLALLLAGVTVIAAAGRQGLPPPPPPPPPPSGPPMTGPPPVGNGAISGIVIDAGSERALAGAIVTLFGVASGVPENVPVSFGTTRSGGTTSSAPAVQSVTYREVTDDRGRFIFPKLPPSTNYTVRASKAGYIAGGPSRPIALLDGEWHQTTKIALAKPSAVSGTVIDEAGEPVVGVTVRVFTEVFIGGMPQIAAGPIGKTDDRGRYRIPGLFAGRYVVCVPSVQWSVPAETTDVVLNGTTEESMRAAEAAGRPFPPRDDQAIAIDERHLLMLGPFAPPPSPVGGRATVYPSTFYPSARVPKDGAPILLAAGEERGGVDIALRPVPAVRVSGRVEGPPEAEGPGMTLRLLPAGGEGLGNGSETATALVARDGSFMFVNVPAGDYTIFGSRALMEYRVRALALTPDEMPSPAGFAFSMMGSGPVASAFPPAQFSYRTSKGAQTHSAATPIAVGDRDVTNVVVTLRRGVSISGSIVLDYPLPAALVRLSDLVFADPADGNSSLGVGSGRAVVEGDRVTFMVEGLQAGRYVLRSVVLLSGAIVKSIVWNGKDYTTTPFDAAEGHDFTGVVMTVTNKGAQLSGFVRDDRSQLAKAGVVLIFPAERERWSGYGFQSRGFVTAGVSTGSTFTANALPAGNYFALALDDDPGAAWRDPAFLAKAAALATPVTVAWGEQKTLDLTIKKVR